MTTGRRRALGQHFLKDKRLAGRITETTLAEATASGCRALLEIGPGKGALTEHVLESNTLPFAVAERDPKLAALWKERTDLTVLEGVETIDISPVGIRRFSGHIYHLFNPEVIEDLTRLLHTGKPASQRPGLEPVDRDGLTYWRLAQ